jgi:hypothetical protein
MRTRSSPRIAWITAATLLSVSCSAFSAQNACTVASGPAITPVIELYTSEGCSSCPPADKWVSSLKNSGMVVQAFHVSYWDHLGWIDRFAAPAYTKRQHEVAARNKLRDVYTPQAVLNGKDLPAWGPRPPGGKEPARAGIVLTQLGPEQFEATVTPVEALQMGPSWSAYWTVTEHGHSSKVRAGENAGEFLKHDFVVRQYTPAGDYQSKGASPQKLGFYSIAATPSHERQINLVVFDSQTGKTLQAVSLRCTDSFKP